MIQFEPHWVDVTPFLASGQQPVAAVRRTTQGSPVVGDVWVPTTSLLEPDCQLAVSRGGDIVRIPIVAYRTQHRAMASLFCLGLQLGMLGLQLLREQTKTRDDPRLVHLAIGSECTDLGDGGFRCYVGLAFQMK